MAETQTQNPPKAQAAPAQQHPRANARKPSIGDRVLYVLPEWSRNKGGKRLAEIVHVDGSGHVVLHVKNALPNDFQKAGPPPMFGQLVWPVMIVPSVLEGHYAERDESGANGTWDYLD